MNSNRDIVFKRCGCTREDTGRQLAGQCPRLAEAVHGSWYYAVQVTTVGGRAKPATAREATRPARRRSPPVERSWTPRPTAAGAWTLARWLRYWLTLAQPSLRPWTIHGYRDHITGTSSRAWAGSPWRI
jgi:hypothetical protein